MVSLSHSSWRRLLVEYGICRSRQMPSKHGVCMCLHYFEKRTFLVWKLLLLEKHRFGIVQIFLISTSTGFFFNSPGLACRSIQMIGAERHLSAFCIYHILVIGLFGWFIQETWFIDWFLIRVPSWRDERRCMDIQDMLPNLTLHLTKHFFGVKCHGFTEC